MKTNEIDYDELKDFARDARRALDREREEITERAVRLEAFCKMTDQLKEILEEKEELEEENTRLRTKLEEKKMKFAEMSKLAAGVAKKVAQDDLLKAFRIFLNTSKRKTLSKREAAKVVLMEIFASAKIVLPDDITEMLNHLDDEQTEPTQQVFIGTLNGTATGPVTQSFREKRLGIKE